MSDQQTLLSDPAENPPQAPDTVWRDEVQAKLARYRSRRGRRIEGAFSMRFPFKGAEELDHSVEPARESVLDAIDAAVDQVAVAMASSPQIEDSEPCPAMEAGPGNDEEVVAAAPILDPVSPPYADATDPAVADTVSLADDDREEWPPADSAPSPEPHAARRPPARRKIIAFPRMTSLSEIPQRLADPVLPQQPRILDVPEELEAFSGSPLLDGLQFGPSPHHAPAANADHIELPFQAASIARRFYAGLVDCLIVGVAAALFGAAAYKLLPRQAISKPLLIGGAALVVLLWAVYQYIFLLYAGATAGMSVAGLRLTTFSGRPANLGHRRNRLLALYFSTASLTMGELWALVDVDALCWHDRISHTYMTEREHGPAATAAANPAQELAAEQPTC